jgi:hypothetical protein
MNDRRWLYFQIHGRKPPQRARRSARRGPARDAKYRAWIRTQPSVVSGQYGCEACHTKNNGMRSKGPDSTCVPLTRAEHREYDAGRAAFERKYGVVMADKVRELNSRWKLGKEEAA